MELLIKTGYPHDKTQFLEQGFREGFDIGYEGPQDRCSISDNLPFTFVDQVQLWNKLMKEVKLCRVTGPFKEIPFKNYIQSPIGLVPKAGSDQTRLIFHLSYEFSKGDKLGSLNNYTPKERCTVKYKDLDFAVQPYLRLYDEIIELKKTDL